MAPVTVTTASAEATRALAARLAGAARPGDVVLLVGGLGAGKTTFAQGFARALGVEGPVTSPTFTLVRQYPCAVGPVGQLLHADVYRLDHLAEVEDLGLSQLVEEGGVALVEWGDAAAPVLGPVACTVTIERAGADDARTVTVEGDPRYREALR
jgi:tRNA threonylcarbamoyladenosine biosynthesis protein TsaE